MKRLAAAAALVAFATPAVPQDLPPQGIGFAQAEEGTWLCRHEDPMEALACAQELCAEQASGHLCVPTAWCLPAQWSGLMTVRLPDFHITRVFCGMPSEAALHEVLAAVCAADQAAIGCDLFLTVDPEGHERMVEGISFAGGAADGTGAPDDGAAPADAPPAQ